MHLLALLNARIAWFFFTNTANQYRGGALGMQTPYVKRFPIPDLTESQKEELAYWAEQQLYLHDRFFFLSREEPSQELKAASKEADAYINEFVYALYGLSDAEIALVEAATADAVDG